MRFTFRNPAQSISPFLRRVIPSRFWRRRIAVAIGTGVLGVSAAVATGVTIANLTPYADDTGTAKTYSTQGALHLDNAFFQSLGTNGRSCGSCHQPADGWSVTPEHVQARFASSNGLDPIFRPVDGAVCPSADVSTLAARQQAYAMLLTKGLIRVSIGVPSGAEFSVASIDDPYNCPDNKPSALALFRRPLPAGNLPFLTTVMWDGRESFGGESLDFDLAHQAMDATLGHAQATSSPTQAQLDEIVAFEKSNFTAQAIDNAADNLGSQGATGGPVTLSAQPFYVGINDPLGGNPTGAAFNPKVFTLFDSWSSLSGRSDATSAARASVARGEEIFNSLQFTISGVTGLNDKPGVPASLRGTCTTCHDAPNVGNHSVALALNIGVTDYPALPALDTTGLPVYTIRCDAGVATPIGAGRTFQTTDPGRALQTGRCADVGKVKGPILRGLAARAPYFHNGSAATLRNVVDFYNQRFKINLTDQEKADLVAFLQSL